MNKMIVLHDRTNNNPIVVRTSAIKAVRKGFDETEGMYSEVLIDSYLFDVKETIATVMMKIKEAESEEV